jgi:hypothetical protein
VFELEQQIFATPSRQLHPASRQQLFQAGREGPAQAVAAQHYAGYRAAFDMGRDSAPCDFNFWQFWHL